jgi:hypothetical protein
MSSADAAHYTSCAPVIVLAIATVSTIPQGSDKDSAKAAVDLLKEMQKSVRDDNFETTFCAKLKASKSDAFNTCLDSGSVIPSVEDLRTVYPALYAQLVQAAELPALYYKLSFNWAPTLVSTDYRSVSNGTPNLATAEHWSSVLNTFALDGAIYYKAWSFGVEAGYGRTVNITQQNICHNQTNGSFTAQQCKNAMIGEPDPVDTASATAAASFTPGTHSALSALVRPGVEVVAHYEHPSGSNGGNKSQLYVPIYIAPISSPLKFVIGLQPTWTWNSEPMQKNDFSVYLFVGARPSVPD